MYTSPPWKYKEQNAEIKLLKISKNKENHSD